MTSVLIATTEGLTPATTSAKLGNIRVSLSAGGGVQSGSMGVAEVGGGLGGGDISTGGSRQLAPRKRHRIIIRQVNRYFMFIPFMADFYCSTGAKLGQRVFVAIWLLCKGSEICYTNLTRFPI